MVIYFCVESFIAMLYGMETVPMTWSHVVCPVNAKRPCEKRQHQGENEGREYHREVQESKTEVVWIHKMTTKNTSEETVEMVPPGRRKSGRPKQI